MKNASFLLLALGMTALATPALGAPAAPKPDSSKGSCISRPKHDYEDDLRIAALKADLRKAAADRHYKEAKSICSKAQTQLACKKQSTQEEHISFGLCRWKPTASKK